MERRFKIFVYDDRRQISYLEIDAARVHRQATTLTRALSRIVESLKELKVEEFLGEETLWDEMESLMGLIRRKFTEADRRIR